MSRPDDMCVRTGHLQGNLPQRVCEPARASARFCGKFCPKGTAQPRRVQWTKQPRRSRDSRPNLQAGCDPRCKFGQRQPNRGKGFLPRDCAQKWVPPGESEDAHPDDRRDAGQLALQGAVGGAGDIQHGVGHVFFGLDRKSVV